MSSSLESGSPPTRNVTGRVAKLSAARIHRACASSARSAVKRPPVAARSAVSSAETRAAEPAKRTASNQRDRKSTRLNSSHLVISYAVFCLKKKKKEKIITQFDIEMRI